MKNEAVGAVIMASGLAGNPEITEENADYDAFVAALTAIAEHMCAEHAGDGEGATHLITCEVTHAPDLKTARAVSRSGPSPKKRSPFSSYR